MNYGGNIEYWSKIRGHYSEVIVLLRWSIKGNFTAFIIKNKVINVLLKGDNSAGRAKWKNYAKVILTILYRKVCFLKNHQISN